MKIGVFDSGIGGLSVYNAIKKDMPEQELIFKNDRLNMPYGNKNKEELYSLVVPIFNEFVDEGCRIIVIACNTVSTTIIDRLKTKYKDIVLIGVEPMIKEGVSLSKNKIISVCATPTTLKSARYQELKDNYAKNIVVLEPDCSDWSYMIENNKIDNEQISKRINSVLSKNTDVIILGCTHYHWIEDQIRQLTKNKALVIQPELSIIKKLKQAIKQLS